MARPSRSSRSVSSRRRIARRKSAEAVSETRSGALTRSTSEAIIVSSSLRIEALGSALTRMCSVPTTVSATRSGALLTPSPWESSDRSSAGERAATASVAPHASVTARLASSALAAARTTSGRPAPGLDRLGDRVQRRQI